MGINRKLEFDNGLFFVDLQNRFLHRVVDSVMNIKFTGIFFPDTGPTDIGLVCQLHGSRNGIDRHAGTFIVVADGSNNSGDLCRVAVHIIEDAPGHDCTGEGMLLPVYQITNVMQKACDLGNLYGTLVITQNLQNIAGSLSNVLNMAETMFRKAQGTQGLIGPLDIDFNGRIVHNSFES